ncbi:FkbM family methyltransferase [Agrobacterium rosae]
MLRKILKKYSHLYAHFFSRANHIKLGNEIFHSALRARGYNNFQNYKISGEIFFISNILKKYHPTTCIDIGANIGNYTRLLLKETNSTVYSFEPLEKSFIELSKIKNDFGDRIKPFNIGIGSETKETTLYYNESASEHATMAEEVSEIRYLNNDNSTTVNITTLDQFCDENRINSIDLIKIDTEGYELDVLLGATYVIQNVRPRFIQIEFNLHQMFRGQSLYSLSKLLPNYDCYQLIPDGWIKRDPTDPLANIYQFSNFIFMRK